MTDGASGPRPRARRLERLEERLGEAGVDALLVSHLPNVRYLSGFTGSTGFLLAGGGSTTLLVDGRYEEQASGEADPTVEVVVVRDGLVAAVAAAVSARGPLRVGLEAEHVSLRQRERLVEEAAGSDWSETTGVVEALRAVKDRGELERIARAASIASGAWEGFLGAVEEGRTERELAGELEYRLRRAGSEDRPFPSIVAAGERSALPHASPSGRPVREGDLLLADFGATVEGYVSDLTRCAVLGTAEPWQREAHGAVDAARAAAVAAVAPGEAAADVDGVVRDRLEADGYLDAFEHSTGHGIGLEVHEGPSLSRHSDEILRAGNVVTIEPGVYLRGRGGIRLEDDVVVREGGARVLTTADRALREL